MQHGSDLQRDSGLWPFNGVPTARIEALHGFAITQRWLDRMRLGSPRVGCGSGAFVSADGLVMTNQHVIRNYLSDEHREYVDVEGFLDSNHEGEIRCDPQLRIDQLIGITDVTSQIIAATHGLSGRRLAEAEQAAMREIENQWVTNALKHVTAPMTDPGTISAPACRRKHNDSSSSRACQVIRLYHGRQYHLYQYKTWSDIRVVFAHDQLARPWPGRPGAYPRYGYDYGFDVGFLRVWENGRPAKTPDYLRLTTEGPTEGEPLFVAGHPRDIDPPEARTRRTVSQVKRMGFPDRLMVKKREQEEAVRRSIAEKPAWEERYGSAWNIMADAQDARQRLEDNPENDPQAWQLEVTDSERRAAERIADAYWQLYGNRIAPDATWTLRLSFGVAKGYAREGQQIPMLTTLGRALGQPGAEQWPLPPRWFDKKDHLKSRSDTPMNFIMTNSTYGGSSGSPVMTRDGEVLGVILGRNEDGECCSEMGINDDSTSRATAVHSAMILEALGEIYDADALLSELKSGEKWNG